MPVIPVLPIGVSRRFRAVAYFYTGASPNREPAWQNKDNILACFPSLSFIIHPKLVLSTTSEKVCELQSLTGPFTLGSKTLFFHRIVVPAIEAARWKKPATCPRQNIPQPHRSDNGRQGRRGLGQSRQPAPSRK